jgi:serine phosphatase RsbU (regulator of sigma subunit)
MLSMLGVGALKDVINDLESTDAPVMTGVVLDKMRAAVKKALNKNNETSEAVVDDGMEMSIIVFPPEGGTMYFGGANQSVLIEHNGEVKRLKGNINSIGNNLREIEHFTTITTEINPGDSVYLFSDGVIDQIGGPDMRKFNIKQLSDFIADNHQLTMDELIHKFIGVMDKWTEVFEQPDDRLLIGIRI